MPDLADGESIDIKGSAAKPYEVKNVGGVYSCTCPAWRNQSLPIEQRTCKHIRRLRGDQAEMDRIGGVLPAKPKAKASSATSPPLLLAQNWDNSVELKDWWISEKLDGVRAYWDGRQFLSRQGNQYHAPDWFVEGLPTEPLDGELWLDRGKFQRTISIVRRQDKSDHWKEIRFVVFDAPKAEGSFENRLEFLAECLDPKTHLYAQRHEQVRCKGLPHLREELARVEALGGEGLMLRQPGSIYEVGRSSTLLKVKTFHDAEAVVLDHQPGRGKFKGKLGALVVQMEDGTEFSVGTGFSDAQRADPPAVGSTITFRYQELTDGGVPRFPSFIRSCQSAAKDTATGVKKAGKKTAKKTHSVAAKTPVSSSAQSAARYFEFVEGKSDKFWEITVDDREVTVRYGRSGSDGTKKTKHFDTAGAATSHADKLIEEKTRKGYVEKAT
ncbi:MAG: DNA ligase [Pirellulales bacterium]|nr:DNA ligase [Pirellulales bacterium]